MFLMNCLLPCMSRFPTGLLSSIPPAINALSKAIARAFRDLLFEIGRSAARILRKIRNFALRLFRWIWITYYKLESRIAALICDGVLIVYAFRFLVVIATIGIILAYWHQWLFFAIY